MTITKIRALSGAALVVLSACTMFDTNISNPNAIQEDALSDPASAPTQVSKNRASASRTVQTTADPEHESERTTPGGPRRRSASHRSDGSA